MTAEIVGREQELEALATFMDETSAWPRALVIEGEAGIGKTTLWRAGVELARHRSFQTLTSSPAEAESTLPFTGLGDLFERVPADAVAELPAPQRRALEVALLLQEAEGHPPDQRTLGVAVLNVIRRLAASGPVVLAIDDVQWLDPSSASALSFVLRRLDDERVAVLVTNRSAGNGAPPVGLARAFGLDRRHRIRVGPLSLGALHRLLDERLGAVLTRPVLRRLHEASGGNPFYALEIARALVERESTGDPGQPLPVPDELRRLLDERLASLPAETQAALGVAAALSRPTLQLVAALADGDAHGVLAPAIDANVVELVGERLRFTHPLLASTAYARIPVARRRELHRELAQLARDADERARHLALATDAPDEQVAVALEEAARRAARRGAPNAAAELAEEALRLTPLDRSVDRLRRTIDAAGHHFEAGDAGRARRLLEEASADAPPGRERAEVLTRLARVCAFGADLRTAVTLYQAVLAEADDDSDAALEAEAGLAIALMRTLTDLHAAVRHAKAAAERAENRGDPAMLAEFLGRRAIIAGLLGQPQAPELAKRAIELERKALERSVAYPYSLGGSQFILGVLLLWHDDVVGALARLDAARARTAELGDESSLPLVLRYRAYADLLAGDWPSALRHADDGYALAIQTGQPSQQAVLVATRGLVLSHLGRITETREAVQEAIGLSEETGAMFGTMLAHSALGMLELSVGNAAEADRHLGPLVARVESAGIREPGAIRFVPDEIEALIVLGRLEEAEALLARLERRARRLTRHSALAAAARCLGLLKAARGDLAAARSALEVALSAHERVPIPFERARTLLALGEVRRRAKQRGAARGSLQEALAAFETLGATLWAERTRAELARVGGRTPHGEALTETERRIASLVAEGRSNKEVAAALFVSPKTVDVNLSRIYAKLGIHSRTELAHRLAADLGVGKV